ncbi:MAG: YfiR family protein [Sedimentisphaerales bacterium]|nr:YfiR family protein [Sedimentisphaerales bacterium]
MRLNFLKTNVFILIVLAALTGLQGRAICAQRNPGSAEYKEYNVKAAFIYNFIKFTDWPDDIPAESNTITIGILGDDPFGNSFSAVENTFIKGKKLIIKRFGRFSDLCKNGDNKEKNTCAASDILKKCHLLFVCKSEKEQLEQIIGTVASDSILTVGEYDGFIEAGGIINLIPFENKIAFEISMVAAKKANLKISSQVLRLAKRVISKEAAEAEPPAK